MRNGGIQISFFVNGDKPRARKAADRLAAKAAGLGIEVVAVPDPSSGASVLVVLGGDGTILRAVHEYPGVPVLGFNLGGLGYLSSVGEDGFDGALETLAAGRFRLVERSMLEVKSSDPACRRLDGPGCCPRALNDVVITREMTGHAAVLEVAVDGKHPTRYLADGLIFSTPTGSTAYSLSAGGPVLMPDSQAFVITPMNPHALGVRPVVVSDSVTISIRAQTRGEGRRQEADRLGVYADGENVMMLGEGEGLTLSKAEAGARFVELEGYDPYEVMARKLGWTGAVI